uniref:Uncharacterized protein n=1 Tax=Glossina pallidipes TaxID=7398 RepID=A0A1A9ZCZ7_GLOPL
MRKKGKRNLALIPRQTSFSHIVKGQFVSDGFKRGGHILTQFVTAKINTFTSSMHEIQSLGCKDMYILSRKYTKVKCRALSVMQAQQTPNYFGKTLKNHSKLLDNGKVLDRLKCQSHAAFTSLCWQLLSAIRSDIENF